MSTVTAYGRCQAQELRGAVARIVAESPVTDLHTHLYSPAFGELLLWGIDELLTYHYLVAETLRVSDVSPNTFADMDKPRQADLVWDELFIKRSPVSEACRGVLTVLDVFGLDTGSRNLEVYRRFFDAQPLASHIDAVFETAGLDAVVMTNDPFDALERPAWRADYEGDGRFHAALRLDALLNKWPDACQDIAGFGYAVEPYLNEKTCAEVRRFIEYWLDLMQARYMAVSLPPDFDFPEDSPRSKLIAECVLPVARERNLPFAMMIGVKRSVNPSLQLAGDGVGLADVDIVAGLCAAYPKNKFMVTMLARENQHELCVAARKFANLLPFGCWWFMNNPSLIDETTRMRIELLGLGTAPQHSDARILEQVIYKWAHSRRIIAEVLADKYVDVINTGWTVSEDEIRRDVARLLRGNFWDFLARKL